MSVTIVWGTMLALQPAVLRENAVGEQLVLLMSRLSVAVPIIQSSGTLGEKSLIPCNSNHCS